MSTAPTELDAAEAEAEDLPAAAPAPEPAPEVEIVDPPEPAAAPAVREKSALEHAAEELMSTPGAPGRDEFLVLATTARILSMSAGAPAAVRNNPWLAFHLALIGRDLGISPSASIALIDVIGYDERTDDYSKVQLSLSPELLNAQIKRMGLGLIVPAKASAIECTAVAMLPGGRLDLRCARVWPEHVADGTAGGPCRCTLDLVLGEHTFSWEDARQAGLVDSACKSPTQHTGACTGGGEGSRGKRCHQGYRSYPKRMMWWRAATYAQADYFPEAGVGLYSPEELGAVVDPETGRPVDPGSAELPEGFEAPEPKADPLDAPLAEADPGGLAELLARGRAIAAAGDEVRTQMGQQWAAAGLPKAEQLRMRDRAKANGVLVAFERRLKRKEFGDEAADAWAKVRTEEAGFGNRDAEDGDAAGSEGTEAPEAAPGAQDEAAVDGGDVSPPEPVAAPDTPTRPPSSKAKAVKAAVAAVEEMNDAQVTAMIGAYEKEPIEDEVGRRGQLVALLSEDPSFDTAR